MDAATLAITILRLTGRDALAFWTTIHAMRHVEAAARAIADDASRPEAERRAAIASLRNRLMAGAWEEPATPLGHLQRTRTGVRHTARILEALDKDARHRAFRSWSELLSYAGYAAAPWGRVLLELHGEKHETWRAADALFSQGEILRRIDRAHADLVAHGRVYLPLSVLREAGATHDALAEPLPSPALREALGRLIDRADELGRNAQRDTSAIAQRRLRLAFRVAGKRLAATGRKLRRRDRLTEPVSLGRFDLVLAGFKAGLAERRPVLPLGGGDAALVAAADPFGKT